jgi:hypothetical protein
MEVPAAEEAVAIKEAAAAWRSRPRWAAVGGGMEEPATPGRGGARGGTACRGGGSLEEKVRRAAVGPGPLVEAGGRVLALVDGAAVVVIDLSEWAWTRGWARCA